MAWGVRVSSVAAVLALALFASAGAAHAFEARGSAEQVYVTGLQPGAQVTLVERRGRTVKRGQADSLGALLFREVRPGGGYRVRSNGSTSDELTVMTTRAAPPSTHVYDQEMPSNGYGYLTTRDGTKLAYYVHPPTDVSGAFPTGYLPPPPSGPTPTLIEYSGYGYANPAGPQSGISILANIMGFTVVDVNMRGTGCSGGSFDFFEPLQNLDGYDVIETVARQPWVLHDKVGMMGISYGGISQLFTAQLQPPSLAAISPLSLIDATHTTLYPGGILNTGFAVEWAKQRQREAMPAGPETGQPWAWKRIQEGDQVCRDNQALHGQAADLMGKIRANDHYVRAIADPLAPRTFVEKIQVPTFAACQWQDEQTGGHCPTLAKYMTGTDRKWFTFTNGTHVDSLDPETFNRWYDFLKLYVAKDSPATNSAHIRAAAPLIYQEAMGIEGIQLPRDPVQEEPTYEGALRRFEQQQPIRVMFENGAGGENPGDPLPAFEHSFASFPIPGTVGRSWYLSRKGGLRTKPPSRAGADAFTWDPRARGLTNFTGDTAAGEGGLWTATPPYQWKVPPAGSAASYESAPLEASTTVIGAGSVQAWVRASAPSVDLQATVTEVRPDGREVFVQNGWLRAHSRKLTRGSTALEAVQTLRKRDRRPLPPGRFAKVTIPLYYQGHAYRAGSKIRVTITAPNGDQPVWSFSEPDPATGNPTVEIGYSRKMPSRLVLPVVPGVEVPTGLPPCPGLRAQPCRVTQPIANRAARP